MTDRWQKFTDLIVGQETLEKTGRRIAAEFLIHAVDVEGLCRGIDRELVAHPRRVVAVLPGHLRGRRKIHHGSGGGDEAGTRGKQNSHHRLGRWIFFGGTGVRYAGRGGV